MLTIFDSGPTSMSQAKAGNTSLSERLYRDLQAYKDSQAVIVAKTRQTIDVATIPLAEYLLRLIGESEEGQAEVLGRIAASLQDALSWSHSPDALPDRASGSEQVESITSVQELLRLEKARARNARRLAKAFAGIGDGFEQTLLEASAMVAESNARLLRLWVRNFDSGRAGAIRRARARWQSAGGPEKDAKGRSATTTDQDAVPTLAA